MTGNRYGVELKDGSMIWVDEETFQKIESGEIDPDRPLSPEEEKEIDELVAREAIRMEKLAAELRSKR